jgi:hypothetical protein
MSKSDDYKFQADLFDIGMTTCGNCNAVINQEDSIIGVVKDKTAVIEDDFCGYECRDVWLSKIRSAGL